MRWQLSGVRTPMPHRRAPFAPFAPCKSLIVACLVAFAPVSSGCAGLVAESAHVQNATAGYVFDEDREEVLAASQAVLFERGFVVSTTTSGALETHWQVSEDGDRRARQLVQAMATDGGTRLEAMRAMQTRDSEGGWTALGATRDPYFELAVIERLDPERANGIRAEAAQAREAAKR